MNTYPESSILTDYLDGTNIELWNERKDWIEKMLEDESDLGGYEVSEQACALMMDLQVVFCAGAWISVIILSMSIIDAQLREVETLEFQGNTEKLLRKTKLTDQLDWLRKRRNKLIHLNPNSPEITVDEQWEKRDELEIEARKAIKSVMDILFLSPFV